MKTISFNINGNKKSFTVTADEKLLDLLRRHGYKGAKWGCGEGSCGACTVLIDGKAVYSCITYALLADGKDVWTIEGLGTLNSPHSIQRALIDEGAVQCGFCIPGMVLSAKAMFDKNSTPDSDTIKEYMDGNLCRCTGYEKIYIALQKVSAANAQEITNE